MAEVGTKIPKAIDLAEQLVSDIEARQLKPGDRYLTTASASKLLGVGNGVANRALQLLERRQVITRQQRRGAFIASLPGESSVSPLRHVHFLVHQHFLSAEGVGNDLVLLGIQEELPGVQVQITFLPKDNADGYVANLIDESLTAKARDGFILVRAPHEVHQLISNNGIPCIVYGGLYPGIPRLACLDRDMAGIGTTAAEYLLNKGHKRIAFLSRQQALPGDHVTMDAIRQSLGNHQLLADTITERFLPAADNVCEEEISHLLKSKNPPTGFICRPQRLAKAAMRVFKKHKLRPLKDVDVVLCDYYLNPRQRPQYVYPRPLYSLEEQGKHMARMLAAHARGEAVPDEIIPVKLDESAATKD